VNVSVVETEKLSITTGSPEQRTSSKDAKKQVINARQVQKRRFSKERRVIYTNSQMRNSDVKKYCQLTPEGENLLKLAADRFDFSARSYFRLIKVSRTIADLSASEQILPVHMAEALQYKQII